MSVVSILDLQSGAIVDQFGAWQPAVSPDGRYIAYIKTFPLHGVEGISNEYLIYDAPASPEVNRPIFARFETQIPQGLIQSISSTSILFLRKLLQCRARWKEINPSAARSG